MALTHTDLTGHDLLFWKCQTVQWWVVWPKVEFMFVYENVPKQLSFGAWATNVNMTWLWKQINKVSGRTTSAVSRQRLKSNKQTYMIMCVGFTTTDVQLRFSQLRFYHLMLSANHPMHSPDITELLKCIMVLSLNQNFYGMFCEVKSIPGPTLTDPEASLWQLGRDWAAPVAPPGGHVTGRVNLMLDLTSDKLFVHSVTEYYTWVLYRI